jgi:hypothetical protein
MAPFWLKLGFFHIYQNGVILVSVRNFFKKKIPRPHEKAPKSKESIVFGSQENRLSPSQGVPFGVLGFLEDNWIGTDLPSTKFESNLKHLSEQPPVLSRKFFYRVENIVTRQADNPIVCVNLKFLFFLV